MSPLKSTSRFNKFENQSQATFAKSEKGRRVLDTPASSHKDGIGAFSTVGESFVERIMSINSASVHSLLAHLNVSDQTHVARVVLDAVAPNGPRDVLHRTVSQFTS